MRPLRRSFATLSLAFLVSLPSYAGSLKQYEPPPMFGATPSVPVEPPSNNTSKTSFQSSDDAISNNSSLINVPLPPKRPKTFYASASFVREMRKASTSAVPVERVYAEPLTERPLDRVDGARLQETSAQDIWDQIQ